MAPVFIQDYRRELVGRQEVLVSQRGAVELRLLCPIARPRYYLDEKDISFAVCCVRSALSNLICLRAFLGAGSRPERVWRTCHGDNPGDSGIGRC